uniref:Tetraspanin n=1 Tax=Xenopsylla cheopis TaxID=163159 RepID=A0A6M2DS10_XENCH
MPACSQNVGMRCIKIMLTLVNVLFLILGVALISVGTTIHAVYNDVQLLLGADWFSPALALTILGVFVLAVTAFGCVGTFKNSTCMINTFGFFLLILFLLEVIVAVSSFAMSGSIHGVIVRRLKTAFHEYNTGSSELHERVDFLQQELRCCGINSYRDWYDIMNDTTLPDSCCSYYRDDDYYGSSSYGSNSNTSKEPRCVYYHWGCARELHYVIDTCAIVLASGTIAICIFQLLGLTFAFQLAKSIRQAKTREDMERWQILHQEHEPLPQTQFDQERIESRDNDNKSMQ